MTKKMKAVPNEDEFEDDDGTDEKAAGVEVETVDSLDDNGKEKSEYHAFVIMSEPGPGVTVRSVTAHFHSPKRQELKKLLKGHPPEKIIAIFKGKLLPLRQEIQYDF